MASSRSAPSAGMPGTASRAVSACTEIIEMWWATTSCSSRAMRARSPRAVCSSSVLWNARREASSAAARARRRATRRRTSSVQTAASATSAATAAPPCRTHAAAAATVIAAAAAVIRSRARASGSVAHTSTTIARDGTAPEPCVRRTASAAPAAARPAPAAGHSARPSISPTDAIVARPAARRRPSRGGCPVPRPPPAKTPPRRDDPAPPPPVGSRGMEATIEVRGLRKRFGAAVAVDGLSFTAGPGQVTGFVGPNGAGKSTTMRMIMGLDRPDTGTALVGGRPYRSLRTPLCRLGAMLDASAVHPARRARDHLRWLAHANGLPARRVDEVIELTGLAGAARRRAGGFSLGMRQRLGIAAALLGDPPVLMFDEPVNGLDPEGITWIRGLLRSLAAEGRAVLVSSHLMSELEGGADHLVVIGRGRLIADTSVADLLAAASGGRVELRTAERQEAMTVLARAGATVTASGPDAVTVAGLPSERIIALLTGAGVAFSGIAEHRASLEEAYMELTRDAVEFQALTRQEAP